ncbi:MAG: ATP-binding protein, partial [Myxococcota bacterium]
MLAVSLMGMMTLHNEGIEGIEPQSFILPEFVQKFCIAVRKGDDELLAAVNEGLALIKQKGIYDQIYEQWMGVYELRTPFDLQYWLVRGGLIIGALLLLLALAIFVQLQRALRRKVAQRTAELRQAVLSAEDASRSKSDFLAHASHEIRTPLNGIIGIIEMLLDDVDREDRQKLLTTIHECSITLLQVLNDVLDLGKIESGSVQLEPHPVDLRSEMEDIMRLFRPLCDRKGLMLSGEVADDVPQWLWLSGKHLRQVLLNLVGNAIKFTREGWVRLSIAAVPRDSAGSADSSEGDPAARTLTVQVSDSGIGIPKELQANLFEPFSAAQREGVAEERGTGLGLAICEQLTELMDGSIAVTSVSGEGSTFTMSLPTSECAPPTERPDSREPVNEAALVGMRVLVAEDNAVSQMVIGYTLRTLGVKAEVVSDGQAAVVAAAERHFDIILLDVQMPVMDGLTAARTIRASSGPCADVPLIAFTAN